MDAYTVAMNQQQQRQPPQQQQHPQPPQHHPQPPRGVTLEDGPPSSHRRNPSRFDSHDDFYDFLESNRGPPMANPGGPSANERVAMSAPQAPIQQQQQQQPPRNLANQSRPPVTNSFPDRSRPPSYASNRSEELPVDKGAKMARQNVRRGAPIKPPSSSSGPRPRASSPTPPVSGGSSPTHPQHGSRPVSGAGDLESVAASIQRLKSPSVMDCVLQPLEAKVREYDQHMRREQDEMKRLDDELRALQARRAEAESRFDEAKAKHDEYRRQYNDVERAMSGELPMSPREPQRPGTMQGAGPMAQQRPVSAHQRRFGDDVDDDDLDEDDEDFAAPPYGPGRRINSTQSFGRASQKTGGKERFRFSNLFGGGRQ